MVRKLFLLLFVVCAVGLSACNEASSNHPSIPKTEVDTKDMAEMESLLFSRDFVDPTLEQVEYGLTTRFYLSESQLDLIDDQIQAYVQLGKPDVQATGQVAPPVVGQVIVKYMTEALAEENFGHRHGFSKESQTRFNMLFPEFAAKFLGDTTFSHCDIPFGSPEFSEADGVVPDFVMCEYTILHGVFLISVYASTSDYNPAILGSFEAIFEDVALKVAQMDNGR